MKKGMIRWGDFIYAWEIVELPESFHDPKGSWNGSDKRV